MKYKTLVVDSPWQYNNRRTGGSMSSGSVQKYEVMSLTNICNLPVRNVMENDSVCFLWCTVPLVQYGFRVLETWEYQYKTMLFWKKSNWGMGFWFRGQVEICLLGIHGKIKPFRYQKSNWFIGKNRGHSRKPEEFFALIEPVAELPRLELFASNNRNNWTCIGLGANGQRVEDFLLNSEV